MLEALHMLGMMKAVLHERLEHWYLIHGRVNPGQCSLALVEAASLQTTPLHALQ